MPDEGRNPLEEEKVNSTEMAKALDLTVRRIQQLTQDGTLNTVTKGKYLLYDNIHRYIRFISGNVMTEEDRKVERARKAAEVKLKVAKADVAKLEADELKGNMHRTEDVKAITNDLVRTIRSMLNALPGRLGAVCANETDTEKCQIIIREAVYAIETELSKYQYDPKKYVERVRARRDWEEKHEQDDDENA